jgi:hypothetical protein
VRVEKVSLRKQSRKQGANTRFMERMTEKTISIRKSTCVSVFQPGMVARSTQLMVHETAGQVREGGGGGSGR